MILQSARNSLTAIYGNCVVSISVVHRMNLSAAEKNQLSARCVNEGRIRTTVILLSRSRTPDAVWWPLRTSLFIVASRCRQFTAPRLSLPMQAKLYFRRSLTLLSICVRSHIFILLTYTHLYFTVHVLRKHFTLLYYH